MYAPFFGLEQLPFSIAPDPRYLFMSERHREALAHLLYGLEAGGGFVLLTGEVGTGKTTVCRCFVEQIPAHCDVAYIFNPRLTVGELLRSVCEEFGVQTRPAEPGMRTTVKDCIDPLNAFLLRAHAAGRTSVLIIDEAQNLAADVLEQLRLLTNLETSERKLLQIILIGQPELRTRVAQRGLEQLAQRVIARYHLGALSRGETAHYVAHRMAVAGLRAPLPFDRRALARVHALSAGVPRRINVLCDRALLGAYSRGEHQVRLSTLRQAAREVAGEPQGRVGVAAALRSRWAAAGAGLVAGAGLIGAAWLAMGAAGPGTLQPTAGAGQGAAVASAHAAAAVAAPATLAQFLAVQPQAQAGEAATWSALAQLWHAQVPAQAPDACTALMGQGLRCYRNRRASLALLRQLDRPALLVLQGRDGGGQQTVLLRALAGNTATLAGMDGDTLDVPLAELAPLWHGEIATVWRAPPELPASGDASAPGAAAAWLDAQLARAAAVGAHGSAADAAGPPAGAAPATTAAMRRARIHRFQLGQGLTPDGQAGPLTLMQLNRATNVDEPRLQRPA